MYVLFPFPILLRDSSSFAELWPNTYLLSLAPLRLSIRASTMACNLLGPPSTLTTADHSDSFDSPLHHRSESDLMKDVEVFYEVSKFQDTLDLNVLDLKLLKRGVLLAQSSNNLVEPGPPNGEPTTHPNLLPIEAKTLTGFENAALKREEAATLNSLPKDLVVILATCANGALVQ